MKRKCPTPLGVLEFTSALNGDDPHSILQKLRHFVKLTRYQRHLALGAIGDGSNAEDQNGAMEVDDDTIENHTEGTDDESLFSLFHEENNNNLPKRPKLSDKEDNAPAWQMDKNDYRVPFVGTSVAKGDMGTVMVGSWPTGFLEVYQNHSPLGVELLRNEYISALPPNGIHRSLCKGSSAAHTSGSGKKRKNGEDSELTNDKLISLSLQNYYWMALSEWVLGFVPLDKLRQDLYWERDDISTFHIIEMNGADTERSNTTKCAIPPEIMTILMKQRMPEWIDTITDYVDKQYQHDLKLVKTKQQQKQQRKKQVNLSKEEQQMQSKIQLQQAEKLQQQQIKWEKMQRRDGVLLTCALRNLRTMCFVSMGTAREVLRRLSMASSTTSKNDPNSAGPKSRGKNAVKGGPTDGINCMAQILQQMPSLLGSTSSSEYCNPRVECITLVCTLLETNDYNILSRMGQAPAWTLKQSSRSTKSDGKAGNLGMLYVALRHGLQYLLDTASIVEESDAEHGKSEPFAQSITRLLRGVKEILLPTKGGGDAKKDAKGNQRNEGFILGAGATADLLSGEVLANLSKLSLFAPSLDTTEDFMHSVLCGEDSYHDVNSIELAAIEARRLLFTLLSDDEVSPFLVMIRYRDQDDQSEAHFFQLSKVLHSLLKEGGNNASTRILLRTCLATTPQLVPHVFQGLHLSDPKPNYRTLSSLTLVHSVVSDAPYPQKVLLSQQGKGGTNIPGLSSDKILPAIIPTCVTKVLLGKVIQSSSALLVSSGLKLIITLLNRANEFVSALPLIINDDKSESTMIEFKTSIYQAVLERLPQISLLLSIPTRFDPFEESSSRSNSVVLMELCKTIQYYDSLDATLIANVQFDWVKLLPLQSESSDQLDSLRDFFDAQPCCAVAILQLLLTVSQYDNSPSLKMLTQVLLILTTTKIPEIYEEAKRLAFSLFKKKLFNRTNTQQSNHDIETLQCNDYECSLWISEIGKNEIVELVTWIGELNQHRVEHKIFVSEAWAKTCTVDSMPPFCTSLLFSFLITKLLRNDDFSTEFSLLLSRMATKLLIFQDNPKLLASIIAYASDESSEMNDQVTQLSRFARSIIQKDEETYQSLDLMPFTMFSTNNGDTTNIKVDPINSVDNSLALRQCLSLMKYQSLSYDHLSSLLRWICAGLLESQSNNTAEAASLVFSAFQKKIVNSRDMQCIVTFFLASNINPSYLAPIEQVTIESQLTCALLQLSSSASVNFPDIILESLKHTTLETHRGNSSNSLRDFLLLVLLEVVAPSSTEESVAFHLPTETVFDLWLLLSKNFVNHYSAKLCFCLEDYLTRLFNTPDNEKDQWILYRKIISMTPELFTETCLQTMHTRALTEEEVSSSCFLASILTYDGSKFGCLWRTICKIDHDDKLTKQLWNNGHLDSLASTLLLQAQAQSSSNGFTKDPLYKDAISVLGERMISILEQKPLRSNMSFRDNLELLQRLCNVGHVPSMLPTKLLDFFYHLEDGSRKESTEDEIYLIQLVIDTCEANEDISLLLSHAFVRSCKILSRLLKGFARNRQTSTSSLLLTATNMISNILDKTLNQDTVSHFLNAIDKSIVTCLKHGITEADDKLSCQVSGECLKVVSRILNVSQCNNFTLSEFTPGQIHSMVVSHSSFQRALSNQVSYQSSKSDDVTQQIELIRLLILCVSLDARHINVDESQLSSILSVYTASTDNIDRLLRRLIYLYETLQCFDEEVMMSRFRWGSLAARQTLDKDDRGWDWLLYALDSNRIRSTLMQFPVTDVLVPPPEPSVEVSAATNENLQHLVEEDDSHSEDEELRENNNHQTSSSKMPHMSVTVTCEWQGSDKDNRYSPGFVLPLILGSLEEYLPIETDYESEGHKSNESEGAEEGGDVFKENREQYEAFCHFSRRLADRGAIALALASLSSRCPLIRKVAISICGIFLKTLQMPESQAIKSWHERPQLEMLMSSVQRGLAVRRAMQIQKAKTAQDASPINIPIPMLPALSAVFLAKSMIVISRPSDEMYGPINRYFLRLKDYHGAFQDCFTLPAFLSLYCNSSDDISRCKIERNWALLALKDGVVDEFCYRIICQSHIPELIMSSIDSNMGSPDSTGEVSLTVEVLSSLIRSGGRRAATHMIHRLGILSWLHGIVSWRDISSILPYTALKCKFLRLITTAVQAYRTYSSLEVPFFEKVPLSNVVIATCLKGYADVKQDADVTLLLELSCEALWEMYLVDQQTITEDGMDCILGQTALDDATALLVMFVAYDRMFPQILASLCALPSTDEGSSSSANLFCKLAMGYIIQYGNRQDVTSKKLILLVITKILKLMLRHSQLRKDGLLSSLVLKCRRLVVFVDGGTEVWERVVFLLKDGQPHNRGNDTR